MSQGGGGVPASSGTGYAIGVDVGGSKVLAVLATGEGSCLGSLEAPSPHHTDGLAETLAPMLAEAALLLPEGAAVSGIGIAVPGLVDPGGHLHAAPNLAAPDVDIDLHELLDATLTAALGRRGGGARVAYENDATSAAYAEAVCGAGEGHGDVLVVSIGTGIGGGYVADGKLVRGAHGYSGEVGHMVIDPDGLPCPCGKTGCWEQYASGQALGRLTREAARQGRLSFPGDLEALRGEDLVAAARAGAEGTAAVVEEFSGFVALGLANLVEVLDPGIVVLGGGVMDAADVLLTPTRAAFARRCRPALGRSGDDVVPASLGPGAAALGAALVGLGRAGNLQHT